MPLICTECGNANRAKAKFCTACAARLGGVEPSGLAALERLPSVRPGLDRGSPAGRASGAGPLERVLPAETPGFWLRLMLLGVVLTVGFMAWYLYVTRELPVPSARSEIAAAAVPAEKPASPVEPLKSTAIAPQAAAPATGPAAAPLAGAPARQDARTPTSRTRPPAAAERARVRTPRPAGEEEELFRGTAPASTGRALALANELNEAELPGTTAGRAPPYGNSARAPSRSADDLGPPIAPGPGPRYGPARATSRFENDPGPPVAPGPGPLYETARASVRAPSRLQDDPGPPIAIGPGPLVDYSARAVRPR